MNLEQQDIIWKKNFINKLPLKRKYSLRKSRFRKKLAKYRDRYVKWTFQNMLECEYGCPSAVEIMKSMIMDRETLLSKLVPDDTWKLYSQPVIVPFEVGK